MPEVIHINRRDLISDIFEYELNSTLPKLRKNQEILLKAFSKSDNALLNDKEFINDMNKLYNRI